MQEIKLRGHTPHQPGWLEPFNKVMSYAPALTRTWAAARRAATRQTRSEIWGLRILPPVIHLAAGLKTRSPSLYLIEAPVLFLFVPAEGTAALTVSAPTSPSTRSTLSLSLSILCSPAHVPLTPAADLQGNDQQADCLHESQTVPIHCSPPCGPGSISSPCSPGIDVNMRRAHQPPVGMYADTVATSRGVLTTWQPDGSCSSGAGREPRCLMPQSHSCLA